MTLGMGMTEKQGGTDVRANTTRAERDGDAYRITGHKWFMSAPMCDAFLVLAQADAGLTCFFMPRFRPDGEINALHFQRLKDKLGNRSNASSEVEFDNAYAVRVGEEGQGIRTILPMVQLTRLDCAISSAGMMRAGLARALHHCRHRSVFQKRLVRPADDANGAGRHGDRGRGRARGGDAALPFVRSGVQRAVGGGAGPVAHAGDKILGLQGRPGAGLRGDGVPRRQRLRRGLCAGAALSRGAGQCDLGGLGQRHGPRRAARLRPRRRGRPRDAR